MKGYVIFLEVVQDAAEFERYKAMSPESIKHFGGEFLVRGGEMELLEGELTSERVVVLQFPTFEAAKAWYLSDEYSDAKQLRLKISEGTAILVAGV